MRYGFSRRRQRDDGNQMNAFNEGRRFPAVRDIHLDLPDDGKESIAICPVDSDRLYRPTTTLSIAIVEFSIRIRHPRISTQ